MILNLENYPIEVLLPKNKPAIFSAGLNFEPFSEQLINALSQLGLFLMQNGRVNPSIIAAGYFLRKKHLLTIKEQYAHRKLLAKGTTFHIAPGNVDTLFFYSMVISVLCGNQTILRISNKLSEDTLALINLINQFFSLHDEFKAVQSLMNVIQYDHNDQITQALSLFCDSRIIWGGDNAVKRISEIPLKDTADNITFPDRYSVAIIHLDDEKQIEQAVNKLVSDIKPFHQQACSSPKVIYWLETAQILQDKLYRLLAEQLNELVALEPTDYISQLVYLQRLPLLLTTNVAIKKTLNDNGKSLAKQEVLQRVELECVTLEAIKSHCGLWVLLNQQINDLGEIELFDHCQTVTVSGIEESKWLQWQQTTKQPMKRIVLAGQALTFSHIWDGVDLVDALTHVC